MPLRSIARCPGRALFPNRHYLLRHDGCRRGIGHIRQIYKYMVETGELQEDRHQIAAIKELDRLVRDLQHQSPPTAAASSQDKHLHTNNNSSFFGRLFSRAFEQVTPVSLLPSPIRGVYLHGGVGCGKTFCMNLFYDNLQGEWPNTKQHVHFHKFMLGVHQQVLYIPFSCVVFIYPIRSCSCKKNCHFASKYILLDARGQNGGGNSRRRVAASNCSHTGKRKSDLL